MDFDVVIVGAGPGGCLAAKKLAAAGLSVGLFDTDDRDSLGKTIIIETERAMFNTVGLELPKPEDVPYHPKRMRVFSGRRKEAFTIEGEHPAMAVQLDRFSKRLLGEAEHAGAKFYGNYQAIAPIISRGRVQGVTFRSGDVGAEVRSRLVIDATGFNAALVRKLDPEMGIGFQHRKHDVVIAENHFHELDAEKAKHALEKKLHYDNEVWNRLGVYGNYSTVYSYMSQEKKRAYILIGLRAEAKQPPLETLIDSFREEHGFFGKWLYGGKGPIRVRRSWDKLVADGFMVIGEAAATVIPAHGSGVASALYTGHLAAKTAIAALKENQTDTAGLWPYCHEYLSGRGGTLACYDANVLIIQTLSGDSIATMMEDKIMHPQDLYNAFVPNPISVSISSLPGRILGLIKHPAMLGTVTKLGGVISAVKNHYAAYPKTYDKAAFENWKNQNHKIFGPLEKAREIVLGGDKNG